MMMILGTSTLKCITRPFITKITHDIKEIRVEPELNKNNLVK
jgi:hypothetical protein